MKLLTLFPLWHDTASYYLLGTIWLKGKTSSTCAELVDLTFHKLVVLEVSAPWGGAPLITLQATTPWVSIGPCPPEPPLDPLGLLN